MRAWGHSGYIILILLVIAFVAIRLFWLRRRYHKIDLPEILRAQLLKVKIVSRGL